MCVNTRLRSFLANFKFQTKICFQFGTIFDNRGGVENPKFEAKANDSKKKKKLKPRPRTDFLKAHNLSRPRTEIVEAKNKAHKLMVGKFFIVFKCANIAFW